MLTHPNMTSDLAHADYIPSCTYINSYTVDVNLLQA